ncbi:MAG: ABC transporter permease [Fervidobacterium sp.]
MVLKIAFRNFTKHWKVGLLAILGTFVATMLLVGGLSLNDSVNTYLKQKIMKNFGKIDLVIKDKSDTIFLPKAVSSNKVENVLKQLSEVEDFCPVKLAQVTAKIGQKYVDLYAISITPEFQNYIKKNIDGVTISYDTAKSFDLKVGDEIEIISAKGTYKVKIYALGKDELNFRGETGSANGTIFLQEPLFEEYGIYPLKEPNAYFVTLNIPIDKHQNFADKLLQMEGSIRITAVKYRLSTSPLNKIIGYLFIGFSGFSVISSFLFIASFFGILTEERKASLGVLRAIGYSRFQMFLILFLEGLAYLIFSEIVGALTGVGFGKYLLYRINSFQRKDDLFAFVQDQIPYNVTLVSIFYAVLVAAFVPIMILIYKSVEFSNVSPAILYTGRLTENEKKSNKGRNIIFSLGVFLFLFMLYRMSPIYFLLGVLTIIPLIFRNNILALAYGISILISLIPILSTGNAVNMLVRAGFSILGSIYIVFGILPYLKALFERIKNIPFTLAVSYIEKYKNRNFAIFVVYTVTLILILVSAIIPTSISKYIEAKKEEGAFGYNFIIIENPIKSFFGSYKYLNDEEFSKKFEVIAPIQLVEATKPGERRKYSIILADERVIEKLTLPSEKLMRELKRTDFRKLPDKSIYLSKYLAPVQKGTKITLTLKGVLPGISSKITDDFNVEGIYDPEETLLPMDGIIIWRGKKLFGAISGYVGVIRDKNEALKAQEFVTRKFDAAVYITGEIEKLYTSIGNLVNLSLQLFYLGFFAGFAGLSVITFRNVYVRKKEIGMLRAIGTGSDVVFKMFIYEALLIVIVATLVAILSSTLIIMDLANFVSPILPSFKIIIPYEKVFLTLLSVFLLTTTFVSIPASLSQRIPPSEALRVFD